MCPACVLLGIRVINTILMVSCTPSFRLIFQTLPLHPFVMLPSGRLYTKVYRVVRAGAAAHPSSVGWFGGVDACHGRTGWCQVSNWCPLSSSVRDHMHHICPISGGIVSTLLYTHLPCSCRMQVTHHHSHAHERSSTCPGDNLHSCSIPNTNAFGDQI